MKYAEEEKADVVLVYDLHRVCAWHLDSGSQRAPILTAKDGVIVADIISDPEFVSVQINDIWVTSCYVSPRNLGLLYLV